MHSGLKFLTLFGLLLMTHAAAADALTFSYSDPDAGFAFQGTFAGTLLDDKNTFAIKTVDSFSYTIDPKRNPDAGKNTGGSWDLSSVMGGDYYWFTQFTGKPQGNEFGSLTIDGSYMDFVACSDPECREHGFSILAGDMLVKNASQFSKDLKDGDPLLEASFLGEKPYSFDASFWSASLGKGSLEQQKKDAEKAQEADGKVASAEYRESAQSQSQGSQSGSVSVPEPETLVIFSIGLLGLGVSRHGKIRRAAMPRPDEHVRP